MTSLKFINDCGDFCLENADRISGIYFPCVNEAGMISAVTPLMGGDSKTGQNSFFMEPASDETLRESRVSRNFWVRFSDGEIWSAVGMSAKQTAERFTPQHDKLKVFGGFLWHKTELSGKRLRAEVLTFVPCDNEAVEIMKVTLTNTGDKEEDIICTAAVPVYGRSADNIRDHRHVTSLLQRAVVTDHGIEFTNSLTFDERGHRKGENIYKVFASEDNGAFPTGCLPELYKFTGEGGTLDNPRSIYENSPFYSSGYTVGGYEMIGAVRFSEYRLEKGESKSYIIVCGVNSDNRKYLSKAAVNKAFEENKAYWKAKTENLILTGDRNFDLWYKWVCIQPVLRRICGCSFLPHHDYGRGGRGWRDLWQDCLALLLTEPEKMRNIIINNFCGVRADGTNATIIGSRQGEFIADRNAIVRLWMDHGMWPVLTLDLYIGQTGDMGLLLEKCGYFTDNRTQRCSRLSDIPLYRHEGTILEHILTENVTMFFDVGAHGYMRLHDADWNDGLDMASENGESVAFTSAYCRNFRLIAGYLYRLDESGIKETEIFEPLYRLMLTDKGSYSDTAALNAALTEYCNGIETYCEKQTVSCRSIADILISMADHLTEKICSEQLVSDGAEQCWFNGYYDNSGKMVEGLHGEQVRMMLTSQVFPLMSGVADREQAEAVIRAVNWYLCFPSRGGVCLNTDFNEIKLDMGRMFGFAYGHKENGAVFSHMAVMYAYALYLRDFYEEGDKVIQQLYEQCSDFEKSRIYPGIPEYFDINGRGMYPYLTGAASWLVLTVQTMMFGISGLYGDMKISPAISAHRFDEYGKASVSFSFCGKRFICEYINENRLGPTEYKIKKAFLNNNELTVSDTLVIERSIIEGLEKENTIRIYLGKE